MNQRAFICGLSGPTLSPGEADFLAAAKPAGIILFARNIDRVTELFDKYNLLALPVVGDDGKLAGVITADDIISVLRQR